jgi:hypothetical protein
MRDPGTKRRPGTAAAALLERQATTTIAASKNHA